MYEIQFYLTDDEYPFPDVVSINARNAEEAIEVLKKRYGRRLKHIHDIRCLKEWGGPESTSNM